MHAWVVRAVTWDRSQLGSNQPSLLNNASSCYVTYVYRGQIKPVLSYFYPVYIGVKFCRRLVCLMMSLAPLPGHELVRSKVTTITCYLSPFFVPLFWRLRLVQTINHTWDRLTGDSRFKLVKPAPDRHNVRGSYNDVLNITWYHLRQRATCRQRDRIPALILAAWCSWIVMCRFSLFAIREKFDTDDTKQHVQRTIVNTDDMFNMLRIALDMAEILFY